MRLSSRSFPHPVVGNADDVPGAEFQATLEFSSDKSAFYLTATLRCSSRSLKRHIKKKAACYSLHVECSNTLFRKIYDFDAETHRITIPATLIHDAVEVNAFIRSKSAIPHYRVEGCHEDYGDLAFDIRPGDILAVADGQVFDALHEVDPLRRVGALMVVVKSEKPGDFPMQAEFDADDKIQIILCESDFDAYGEMKAIPHLTSHLTTTLVLPVLMQAIHLLDGDDPPKGRWVELLRRRLSELNLGSMNELEKAQRLLDLPIRRALSSAKLYSESYGS